MELPDYENSKTVGAPMLPTRTFTYIIPSGMKVSNIVINSTTEEELTGSYDIYPAQPEKIISLPEPDFVEPDPAIYENNAFYPANCIKNNGNSNLSGAKIFTLQYYPIKYNPVTKKLVLLTNINFTLEYEPDYSQFIKPFIVNDKFYNNIKSKVQSIVENPGDFDVNYQSGNGTGASTLKHFIPSNTLEMFGNSIEYIIITNNELKSGFQEIADWKIKTGVSAMVITTEWIASNYSGCDLQEKIRNCIIDAYSNTGTQWVLIGGDNNVVPARIAWKYVPSGLEDLAPYGDFVITDIYYSALDGNWNTDGDVTFGEGSYNRENDGSFTFISTTANIDEVDLSPDVYLGRIPAENIDELDKFLVKYFEYVKTPSNNQNDMMYFTQSGFSINLDSHFPTYADIYKYFVTSESPYNTKADVLNAFNGIPNPYHIIIGLMHGGPFDFGACEGSIYLPEIDNLNNTVHSQIFFANSCHTMPFDYDCIAERFIASHNPNTNGGGVTYIGNT
ncbi:MAG: C25 family cysteine peptidase, partial [Bacteroidales bacterium]